MTIAGNFPRAAKRLPAPHRLAFLLRLQLCRAGALWLIRGGVRRARSASDEAPQQREIFAVLLQVGSLRSFQTHRQTPEAPVVHQHAKSFNADKPLADMLVTVEPRVEFFFRIVQVK